MMRSNLYDSSSILSISTIVKGGFYRQLWTLKNRDNKIQAAVPVLAAVAVVLVAIAVLAQVEVVVVQ